MKDIPKGSEDFRRKNPHVFGRSPLPRMYVPKEGGGWDTKATLELYEQQNSPSVAPVPATKPEQNKVYALDQGKKTPRRSRTRVVLRVTLIRCGQRILDDDNLAACFKGIRDSIAATLSIDDADKRIEWRYAQIESRYGRGTVVKFDLLATPGDPRRPRDNGVNGRRDGVATTLT